MLHCAILRSPVAHARIATIDVSAAEKLPGVVAVVTGEDAQRWSSPAAAVPEGWGTHCLPTDKVRFVGEPVAAVAADQPLRGRGRARADRRRLRAPRRRDGPGARRWSRGARWSSRSAARNVMMQRRVHVGRRRRGLRERRPRLQEKFRWNRLGANPMETFGCISEWNPVDAEHRRARRLPVAVPHGAGPRGDLRAALEQGAHDRPPPRRELRRQGRHPRHRHLDPALAQGGRAAGQVDRGPHGVPRGRRQPGLGSALRGLARRQAPTAP